ncbi:Uncharacterised protein [Salmonella enterica subsp. arizonae]|uniref:Uncharacterized protein n=1 Tax=Salmonella enterica subsp. arizonae TaxID=59203 RepID=A0A379TDI3_SALER|nr:Uncharacterised protein [Salmonella enterica subsp. arizonae]
MKIKTSGYAGGFLFLFSSKYLLVSEGELHDSVKNFLLSLLLLEHTSALIVEIQHGDWHRLHLP